MDEGISLDTISQNLKLPKINIMLILFLTFVLNNYIVVNRLYGFVYFFMIILIFFKIKKGIIINKEKKKISSNIAFWLIISILFFTFHFSSSNGIYTFSKSYLPIFLIFIYGLIEYNKFGFQYGEQFFKQLTTILNIFSVANIPEVIYKKPLLYAFLNDHSKYEMFVGTENFRTISVFAHPIVSGLFFSLLFVYNIYLLKHRNIYIFYILQIIALINIYFSFSRSTWISLAFVLLLFFIKKFNLKNLSFSKFKTNYGRFYFGTLLILIIFVFLGLNYELIINTIINRFGDSLNSNSTDISNLQRTATIDIFVSHIFSGSIFNFMFGNGIGTAKSFMLSNTAYLDGFGATDNMYLTLFFEFGFILLLVYILLLVHLIYRWFFSKNSWLTEISILSLILISIDSFFFESVYWGNITLVWSFSLLTFFLSFKQNMELNAKKENAISVKKKRHLHITW